MQDRRAFKRTEQTERTEWTTKKIVTIISLVLFSVLLLGTASYRISVAIDAQAKKSSLLR
jgi:hypothetical protein